MLEACNALEGFHVAKLYFGGLGAMMFKYLLHISALVLVNVGLRGLHRKTAMWQTWSL